MPNPGSTDPFWRLWERWIGRKGVQGFSGKTTLRKRLLTTKKTLYLPVSEVELELLLDGMEEAAHFLHHTALPNVHLRSAKYSAAEGKI